MNETQLSDLADQVASILQQRADNQSTAWAAVGVVAVVGGAGYMTAKVVQRVKSRRWMRKNWK